MMKKILILIIFCCCLSVFSQKPTKDLKPTVILISLDGFRYDYLDKFAPPTLSKLAKNGVRAKWMIPSFPTKTFPNHYTVATGLYPQNHGIVANDFYDKGFNAEFGLSKREEVENPRWWFGEPIWVTAEKQGQISASYFFVGTETAIQGIKPKISRMYNGRVPNEMRVDEVLSWFDLPTEKRPTMITMYFSETDDVGHEFSPESKEIKYSVLNADRYIGRLIDGLKARKIDEKVNVIIFSDHGMVTVDNNKSVIIDDYLDAKLAEKLIINSEIVQIYPKAGKEDEIMNGLKKMPHATCWRKSEIPARLHYNKSPRIGGIVCSTEEGWILTDRERFERLKKTPTFNQLRGAHGYDNKYQSMQATFIAHGAAFKKGFIAEPFENIHVYNLMCRILGLKPAMNDGNLDVVRGMLR